MLFKDQLNFLTEEDGRCLQVVNGIVTSLANRMPIDAPMGWLDILVSWELDMKRGLLRSMATPLEFVWDGARIVGHVAINENMERKIYLLIKKLQMVVTDTEINPIYRFLYKGELDLSTVEIGDYSTKCAIMEGGINKLMKANAGTMNEYPFDDEAIYVKMDGMDIRTIMNFLSVEQIVITNVGTYAVCWLPISFVDSEGTVKNAAGFSQTPITRESNSHHDDNYNDDNYFFEATSDLTIPLEIASITATLNNGLSGEIYIKNSNGTRTKLVEIVSDNPAGVVGFTKSQIFPVQTVTLNIQAGEKLYLLAESVDSPLIPGGSGVTWSEFQIKVDFFSRYKTTFTKAYKPFDFYRRLVNKTLAEGLLLPGVDNAAKSDLLQANSNLVVTCGDANRGIEGAKVKTHLNDFFDAFNAILSARMQVNGNKLEFESLASFFDFSDPYHLGECKDLTAKFANDIRGNVLKIGYPKQNIEDTNGRYSFNNTHIYSSSITKVVKNIELIAPYITDPYYIEINRQNLEGKTTTDSNSDNDVMILNIGDPIGPAAEQLFGLFYSDGNKIGIGVTELELVKGQKIKITGGANDGKVFTIIGDEEVPMAGRYLFVDGPVLDDLGGVNFTLEIVSGRVYELKRVAYDNAGNPDDFGIPSPETAFNIEQLTPKRMLQANGGWLRSLFWQFDNQDLIFNTTEVNGNLKTVTGGVTIKEGDNQSIMALAAPLFKPVNLEFEIDVPLDLVEILETNPRRCFSVDWNGTRYVGFLRKAAFAPSTHESQSFVLLSAPFNDLSKLVIR